MTTLDEIVVDAFRRHEEGDALVREVVAREGAPAVVATVARLVRARAPRYGEGLLFLMDGLMEGREVTGVAEAITADAELASALEEMLAGPSVHDRTTAIWTLGRLPVANGEALLVTAAGRMLDEKEVVSLSSILAMFELPDVVDRLAASEDWLLRWALLPWTNASTDSELAGRIRKRLAADPNPFVAAEAAQHIAIIEKGENAAASAEGWTFYVVSNHGPAASFREMTSRFVQGWPPEKTTYDLEELRAFAATSKS